MIILTVRTHGQQQQKTDIYRAHTHDWAAAARYCCYRPSPCADL